MKHSEVKGDFLINIVRNNFKLFWLRCLDVASCFTSRSSFHLSTDFTVSVPEYKLCMLFLRNISYVLWLYAHTVHFYEAYVFSDECIEINRHQLLNRFLVKGWYSFRRRLLYRIHLLFLTLRWDGKKNTSDQMEKDPEVSRRWPRGELRAYIHCLIANGYLDIVNEWSK